MINRIDDKKEKKQIARHILESLPEWFGIPEARENYISGSADQIFLAACHREKVKTVQMGRYDEYDATNMFYLHCGFKEFEVFPALWGKENPCQIYVMSL